MNKITKEIGKFFNFGDDRMPEQDVVAAIASDVDFHGAKLWLLIIAIFVASLGLNTNSTAVIIGAMLISPLMGPIIGMGMGVGIYDFTLFKQSIRNYLIATIFSVITATLYFLVSPTVHAQSELLARTSPTIYDVGIALCGGLAGMIALSSRSQRYGNVIPGVAIATALMPPLCTVGYGIATRNGHFAFGAMYLYLINTVFIVFSTTICVAFVLRFKKRTLVDKMRQKRLRKTILIIALATLIPSVYLTLRMVQSTIFEQRANQFVQTEMDFEQSTVVRVKADMNHKNVQVVLFGNTLDSVTISNLQQKLPFYNLAGTTLDIVQGNSGLRDTDVKSILADFEKKALKASTDSNQTNKERTEETEGHYTKYASILEVSSKFLPEIQNIYPSVGSIAVSDGKMIYYDSISVSKPVICVNVLLNNELNSVEKNKIKKWIKYRLEDEDILVSFNSSIDKQH